MSALKRVGVAPVSKPVPSFDWSEIEKALGSDQKPPKGAVTVEEFANHFGYSHNGAWTHLWRATKDNKLQSGKFTVNGRSKSYFWPK